MRLHVAPKVVLKEGRTSLKQPERVGWYLTVVRVYREPTNLQG